MDKKNRYARLLLVAFIVFVGIIFLAGAGGYIAFIKYPSIGAQGADSLRKVFGDEAVAKLESVVFQAQDTLRRLQYRAGAVPQAPWSAITPETRLAQGTTAANAAIALQTVDTFSQMQSRITQPAPVQSTGTFSKSAITSLPAETPVPPAPAGVPVCPPPVTAFGIMEGEGVWSPYLLGSIPNQVAACRTFFQPDPERPYAIAAVVAFNMSAVDPHFVLGTQEPASSIPVDRPGIISPADLQPGVLLAVFNGGFKAHHGHYGVMVNGIVVIPPKDGFGTIALYKDGRLRIGAWGSDITPTPDILFWRQNGPLLVQGGQVNPRTYNQSIQDWGSTVDGSFPVATWRSAMGMSADGKTMYYAAGPSLTLQSLAQALITAGASQAVQLDINNYWVYFGQVVFNDGKPKTIPLFPDWKDNPDRYLQTYTRDFFYVTAKHN
jgi:hypothetical protein